MKKIIIILIFVLLFLISVVNGSCTQISGETPNLMYTPAEVHATFFLGPVNSAELCYQHSIPEGGKKIFTGPYNETYLFFNEGNMQLIVTPKNPSIIDNILGVFGL